MTCQAHALPRASRNLVETYMGGLQLPKRNSVASMVVESGCFGGSADLSLVFESLAICA